ncbi:chromosome partitioning protein ParB [Pacificimonas flava]|uniref:Chromosome partitioning protein ParB n=2 Tax=Pacificimonas TaxID=1960290 RepID=A0A219B3H7_9SPHN|nr:MULTISPECIES: ParB/RepB/Spo0J family partition protein [Pacificimonas]MBZ6377618.1 ParB/RepB/Spo0J family partition protein [Pacificimonas aurantium]OWV32693.1 chromosome partitioning protein ParB [Pacificimonas flava]
MSERRRPGLGRGLSALLEEIDSGATNSPVESRGLQSQIVALSRVRPNPGQPRRRFDETAQAELIESVRTKGLLQPVLVRPVDGGMLEIVAGERRWRAARAAQLEEIPVVVRDLDDGEAYELALIENIQRQDLSPVEEARGYQHLMTSFGHTQQTVASMVGKSRSHVANLVRLLDLPDRVLALVDEGELGMGHARALLGSPDAQALADRIVAEGLTAREAEALGQGRTAPSASAPSASGPRAAPEPEVAELEALIADSTGLRVSLKPGKSGGKLVLSYRTAAELDAAVARLTAR